jgi:predicted nuclease of predicted toxin-antitoxin system
MAARRLRILSDENIHGPICRWLQSMRRVDIQTARGAGLLGQRDETLVRHATREGRILLASDKGLSEQNYEVCTHAGIINVWRLSAKPWTCRRKLSRVLAKARRMLPHNVVHLGEDRFWIVEPGNRRRAFRYR